MTIRWALIIAAIAMFFATVSTVYALLESDRRARALINLAVTNCQENNRQNMILADLIRLRIESKPIPPGRVIQAYEAAINDLSPNPCEEQ